MRISKKLKKRRAMKELLQQILDECFISQTKRSAYYSEAAVQLKIGIELYKRLKVEPMMEKKIPKIKRNEYLDIFINTNTGRRYGIELKYKTTNVNRFQYVKQGAQNNGRYDFLKDVQRLEKLKSIKKIHKGFAILLTNDASYWSKLRTGSAVAQFELPDSKTLKKKFKARWKGRKGKTITLARQYTIKWSSECDCRNGKAPFRYCLIEM